MSIISNSIIKRGDKLTSSQLNGEFTAVNTGFPMNKNNLANESLDLPVFDTNNTSGKSGIILKQMDMYTNGSSATAYANTATTYPFTSGTVIHTETVLYTCEQNDMLRIYWNLSLQTFGDSSTYPIGSAGDKALCWVFLLEWQLSSGGAWTQVPNQGNVITSLPPTGLYGNNVLLLYGCSLESHVNTYYEPSSPSDVHVYAPKHNNYGQWYYKVPSAQTIYGLRIRCMGLYTPQYIGTSNAIVLLIAPSGSTTHYVTVDKSELGFIQMRDR